jgi:putative SOS response-associated peptidase YedK
LCGRYFIESNDNELTEIIAAAERSAAGYSAPVPFNSGEIFPGAAAPVITAEREVKFMTWGFPDWTGKRPHINARSETAAAARTFREAMAVRRCIIPASSYYEWKSIDKKQKEKYEFRLPDRSPLYMAGIYSPDGRFAVLTREAAPELSEIHDRMPVILLKERTTAWLIESPEVMLAAVTEMDFAPVPPAAGTEQMKLF